MSPQQNTAQKDYTVLKLKPGASLGSIKDSYKTLVKIWHPDLFPSDQPKAQEKAHKMFLLINESYNRLIKYHENYSKNDYSETHQEPSYYENHRESSNWGNDETPPTQTIEMVDKKWTDGTKYAGMTLGGQFHGSGIYTYPNGDTYTGELVLVRYKARDSLFSRMVISILALFLKTKCMAKGKCNLLLEDITWVTFQITSFMGRVY